MKDEVQRLIKITQDSEADRKKAVEEIRELKENLEKQKKEQSDLEWEHISRTIHWRNTIDQLEQLTPERSNIKLKTVLNGNLYGEADYALFQLMKKKQQNQALLKLVSPADSLPSNAGSKEGVYKNNGPVSGQQSI